MSEEAEGACLFAYEGIRLLWLRGYHDMIYLLFLVLT